MLSNRYLEDITYQNPTGETFVVDADGYKTGEKTISYSTPQTEKAFVSASIGEAILGNFGLDDKYSKVLMIKNKHCDIIEGAKVTIGNELYYVKRVFGAKCLSYLPVGLIRDVN